MLSSVAIAEWLERSETSADPLIITPSLIGLDEYKRSNSSSIDLRLGTWFLSTKTKNWPALDVYADPGQGVLNQSSVSDLHYVPFDKKFYLHPGRFVLAVTLEWIRIPLQMAGMVTGKSSWGRRGLIVETAPGVHPGFSGCLTLEMTNVGEVPIALMPGESICQLFLHKLEGVAEGASQGEYFGQRQPKLGTFKSNRLGKVSA